MLGHVELTLHNDSERNIICVVNIRQSERSIYEHAQLMIDLYILMLPLRVSREFASAY